MPQKNKPARRRFGALEVRPLTPSSVKPFCVLDLRMRPGAFAPALLHRRTAEFFWVLEGSASGIVDGKRVRFRRGQYAYLPPGVVHQFRAGPKGIRLLEVFAPALDLGAPDIIKVSP